MRLDTEFIAVDKSIKIWSKANVRAFVYGLLNITSASGIVFANKYVLSTRGFHFTYALTWIHTMVTILGMRTFSKAGLFQPKQVPALKLTSLAASFVAYIVLCNLSLTINTVGFYQIMKIAVAPTVIAMELLMFGNLPNNRIMASVLTICVGIAIATVSDSQVTGNIVGILVGVFATLGTALYQIWAGSKQKEFGASSMQLLSAYTPQAGVMLGLLVPLLEPIGWRSAAEGTLLGYPYTLGSITAIVISSLLGLLVSLSTFLFIGSTSALTYNVVGHMKTVIILTGGYIFFGDAMHFKKLFGVSVAMAGILWYTQQQIAQSRLGAPQDKGSSDRRERGGRGNAEDPLFIVSQGLAAKSAFTALGMSSRAARTGHRDHGVELNARV